MKKICINFKATKFNFDDDEISSKFVKTNDEILHTDHKSVEINGSVPLSFIDRKK